MRNMIKGTYTFFEDGKQIAQSHNIITKFGKRFITNFIAGGIADLGKDLAFGVGVGLEVSGVSANGTYVTFTTKTAHKLSAGNKFSTVNITPSGYNFTNASVYDVPTSTTFRVASTASGSYVSGGSVITDVDTRLEFEFYRMPIDAFSTDIQTVDGNTTYFVIYKSTLPQDVAGTISEIGLYPSSRVSKNNYDSKFISDFSNYLDWKAADGTSPEIDYDHVKIGLDSLKMSAYTDVQAGSSTKEYFSDIFLDMSGYSTNDTLSLSYYKHDDNLQSIDVFLYSLDSGSIQYTITPESGTGYKMSNIPLIPAGTTGTVDKTNISRISLVITGSSNQNTSVSFDGIRINDEDTFDPAFGIISRSVLDSPYLVKTSGRQVDVEYKLELTF